MHYWNPTIVSRQQITIYAGVLFKYVQLSVLKPHISIPQFIDPKNEGLVLGLGKLTVKTFHNY